MFSSRAFERMLSRNACVKKPHKLPEWRIRPALQWLQVKNKIKKDECLREHFANIEF